MSFTTLFAGIGDFGFGGIGFGYGTTFFSGTFFGGGGLVVWGIGFTGRTDANSSSSRLSAEGSLSEPELSPSSLPVVKAISFLFLESS